jgi:hypothetical protein
MTLPAEKLEWTESLASQALGATAGIRARTPGTEVGFYQTVVTVAARPGKAGRVPRIRRRGSLTPPPALTGLLQSRTQKRLESPASHRLRPV